MACGQGFVEAADVTGVVETAGAGTARAGTAGADTAGADTADAAAAGTIGAAGGPARPRAFARGLGRRPKPPIPGSGFPGSCRRTCG